MQPTFAKMHNIPYFDWLNFVDKAIEKSLTLDDFNTGLELLNDNRNYPTSFYRGVEVNTISALPADRELRTYNLHFQSNIESQEFERASTNLQSIHDRVEDLLSKNK